MELLLLGLCVLFTTFESTEVLVVGILLLKLIFFFFFLILFMSALRTNSIAPLIDN